MDAAQAGGAAERGAGAAGAGPRSRALELAALVALLLAAFLLRTRDLESFRIGPDDGAYLHSARIHTLERGGNPLEWIADDARWARELAALYSNETETYQHSYLHQLATRWLYRMGCGALQSLRLSSAITGTLSVLFVWILVARLSPRRRSWALLAAAVVAFVPQHVFLSRTGWGQAGFTCWYLAFLAIAHRVLVAAPEPDTRARARCALWLAATSLLAFGWHEGVAPYVAGTALVALAAPWIRGERWSPAAVLRSGRTWTYVVGASAVGALTVALMLWSPFAQSKWGMEGISGRGRPWFEHKRLSFENLFVTQRLDLLISWPVLVLAVVGFLWLRRADRTAARWLALNALAGALVLALVFGDAWLMRAYLPSYVILDVLAAAGVLALGQRFGHAVAAGVGALLLAYLAASSWSTLFGRHLGPLYVQKLYDQSNQLDHRHVDDALYDLLQREIQPGDRVAAFGDKAVIFKLLDRGIPAQEDYLQGPREGWPRWIVGAVNVFEKQSPQFEGNGGPYKLRLRDNVGRHGLYELGR